MSDTVNIVLYTYGGITSVVGCVMMLVALRIYYNAKLAAEGSVATEPQASAPPSLGATTPDPQRYSVQIQLPEMKSAKKRKKRKEGKKREEEANEEEDEEEDEEPQASAPPSLGATTPDPQRYSVQIQLPEMKSAKKRKKRKEGKKREEEAKEEEDEEEEEEEEEEGSTVSEKVPSVSGTTSMSGAFSRISQESVDPRANDEVSYAVMASY